MQRIQCTHTYEDIISMENLLGAWKEFVRGKRKRVDVQEFQLRLFQNIQQLHSDLKSVVYTHGDYSHFKINDPKPRDIHKTTVRDRLLHHAVYRKLYPLFDRTFISDSYSCRNDKGTHRAFGRFNDFVYKASFGHTKTVWVLKCDVKKFFASIDHQALFEILGRYIPDKNTMSLICEIVSSFCSTKEGVGLPLGNLTSQLLVNIYMNEFDQFMKHKLKVKYYIRYADDFVIIHQDRKWLELILVKVTHFLDDELHLNLHPQKISINTFASGVDFLGWVHFPTHQVLRTATKRRMFNRLNITEGKPEVVSSYLGLIRHGNAKKLKERIEKEYGVKSVNLL